MGQPLSTAASATVSAQWYITEPRMSTLRERRHAVHAWCSDDEAHLAGVGRLRVVERCR